MHQALWSGTAIFILSKALVFHWYRLDRGMWRYFNVSDTIRVTAANASFTVSLRPDGSVTQEG